VPNDEYLNANRVNWDERVDSHLRAYGADEFVAARDALTGTVREDLRLMAAHLPAGTVAGLTMAHLQCHIGMDTLSWARLGASVTGVDFSEASIVAARELADRAGLDARFVVSDIDGVRRAVPDAFDIVYTSIGVLPWLPRLDTWARAIFDLLTPGGLFFVRDAHPMLNAIDWDSSDQLILGPPYFESGTPLRYDEGTTYADDDVRLTNSVTYEWPHSLSEILQSLLAAGLEITSFEEHRTIPWQALAALEEGPDGFVLPGSTDRLPLTFSLTARRPAK
jgi:SAM-dependent methyltransferase